MDNIYKFSEQDLIDVFNFVINYHLNPTKGLRGRTNTGARGFGGELEEFIPGKLIEVGCCRILEKFGKENKKLYPDFKIYDDKEVGDRSDPDITKVKINNLFREPNLFLEVKRLSSNSDWIGPRKHQFKEGKNGFMIHATIKFDDENYFKGKDIIASIWKKLIDSKYDNKINFERFSDFGNLTVKVDYIYPFSLIREKGHYFKKGEIIPETIFPSSVSIINRDGSIRRNFSKVAEHRGNETKVINMKIEPQTRTASPVCPDYSEWRLDGSFDIYVKDNKEYLYCLSPVKMFNNIFGLYNLEKGISYRFFFKNKLGKNTYKNIDDYWFSKNRLNELIKNDTRLNLELQMKEIIEAI